MGTTQTISVTLSGHHHAEKVLWSFFCQAGISAKSRFKILADLLRWAKRKKNSFCTEFFNNTKMKISSASICFFYIGCKCGPIYFTNHNKLSPHFESFQLVLLNLALISHEENWFIEYFCSSLIDSVQKTRHNFVIYL